MPPFHVYTLSEVEFHQDHRLVRIRALHAVSQFKEAKFDEALSTFINLDINPAKVIALYPESISGRLAVPPERWISLYGGGRAQALDTATPLSEETAPEAGKDVQESNEDKTVLASLDSALLIPAATGSLRGRLKNLGGLIPSGSSRNLEDDSTPAPSTQNVKKPTPSQPSGMESSFFNSVLYH